MSTQVVGIASLLPFAYGDLNIKEFSDPVK